MEENEKNQETQETRPTKNWLTALLLCWFLGFFGIHRLYAGRILEGFLILYWTIVSCVVTYLNVWLGLSCFVGVGAVVVFDFVTIAMKRFKDCYGNEIVGDKLG